MFKKTTLLFLTIWVLAACQQEETPPAVPTRVDVFALETDAAGTTEFRATISAPTMSAPDNRPTLPPTDTPTDTPLPPTATATASTTPEDYSPAGTIYYVYNGDSIIAVAGDGSREEFLYTAGMDIPIAYLTPSPDGQWLAFVAPGSGSAREVWIMNRDGSYTQQVSCLGFADVRMPAWNPDSEWLAFAATQSTGGPLDLYAASRVAPFCSDDTHRLLANIDSIAMGGLAYAPSGEALFFSNPVIYALDLASGEISPALTRDNGFGPDQNLAFSPHDTTLLTYLQAENSTRMTSHDGFLFAIDVAATRGIITPEIVMRSLTDTFQWSQDSRSMLLSSQDSIYLWDREENVAPGIVVGTSFPPQAIFSPDDLQIAFFDADSEHPTVPQIFVVGTNGRDRIQITNYSEGTITDLVWLAGGW